MLTLDISIKETFLTSFMKFSSWNKREAFKNSGIFHQSIKKKKKIQRIRCLQPNWPTTPCYIAQVFWVVSFLAVLSF